MQVGFRFEARTSLMGPPAEGAHCGWGFPGAPGARGSYSNVTCVPVSSEPVVNPRMWSVLAVKVIFVLVCF